MSAPRLVRAAAAALLLVALPVAARAHDDGLCRRPVRVWLVRRQGRAPRPLTLTVHATPRSAWAMVFVVGTRTVNGHRVVLDDGHDGTQLVGGLTGDASAYAYTPDAGSLPNQECSAPGVPRDVDVDLGRAVDHDYYVGAYDEDVTLTLPAGWTATRADRYAEIHVYGTEDTEGTGLTVGGAGVEHFVGTGRVGGGPYGSVAFASLPCTGSGLGTGAARLTGGTESASPRRALSCAQGATTSTVGGSSEFTRWQLAGDAVGASPVRQRLAVFGLPPV